MPDCMNFPDNIMDFIDDYSFEDSDHVYTNGSKLIQSFRVKQAVEHYFQEREPVEPREQEETRTWTVCGNCSQHLISKWLWCPYCGRKVKWN